MLQKNLKGIEVLNRIFQSCFLYCIRKSCGCRDIESGLLILNLVFCRAEHLNTSFLFKKAKSLKQRTDFDESILKN